MDDSPWTRKLKSTHALELDHSLNQVRQQQDDQISARGASSSPLCAAHFRYNSTLLQWDVN